VLLFNFQIAGVQTHGIAFAGKILTAGSERFKQWVFFG
jgi:hypothetical protein